MIGINEWDGERSMKQRTHACVRSDSERVLDRVPEPPRLRMRTTVAFLATFLRPSLYHRLHTKLAVSAGMRRVREGRGRPFAKPTGTIVEARVLR